MGKKKWTKAKYKQLCKDVHADMQSEGMTDENAYDIADSLLDNEPGLREFIVKELGASDYRGRLASDI